MIVITPINDLSKHDDYSTTCECEPKIKFTNGEMIIIHNSFDQREIIEEFNRIIGLSGGSYERQNNKKNG